MRAGAYHPEGGRARGLAGEEAEEWKEGEREEEEEWKEGKGEEVRQTTGEGEGRAFGGSAILWLVARVWRRWRRRRRRRRRATLRQVSTTRTMATHHVP